MSHCSHIHTFPRRISVSAVEIKGVDHASLIETEGRVNIALGIVRGLTATALVLHFTVHGRQTRITGKCTDIAAQLVDATTAFALLRRVSALHGIARRAAVSDWEQSRLWHGENLIIDQLIPQIDALFVECENNAKAILADHNAGIAAMVRGSLEIKAVLA